MKELFQQLKSLNLQADRALLSGDQNLFLNLSGQRQGIARVIENLVLVHQRARAKPR